ncbi:hypothetical protein OXPF_29370 [Oxobacter pfennigii]|uniref:Uncharacterized protein n=1 Tax=Oxobacter pfennigii TaxID=36849 RepID=A0A0N8NT06_9CLOT|nr:hypothetical protein OXPF_29370 [Oxobacter pfennigii]
MMKHIISLNTQNAKQLYQAGGISAIILGILYIIITAVLTDFLFIPILWLLYTPLIGNTLKKINLPQPS